MQTTFQTFNKQKLNLHGILDIPDGEGPYPAIVVLHGFTGFKEELHIQDFALELAKAGFVAFRFDASGFGGSEGTIEDDFRVSNYLDDISCILDYAESHKEVDSSLIGVCGHSMGAGLAIIKAAQDSRIKAVCAVQPSAILMKAGQSSYDLKQWESAGWLEMSCEHPKYSKIRLPWDFATDRNRFDAVSAAGELQAPLMVMYGTEDSGVGSQPLTIFESAREPKELVRLDGFNHDFRHREHERKVVNQHLVDFFNRTLKT